MLVVVTNTNWPAELIDWRTLVSVSRACVLSCIVVWSPWCGGKFDSAVILWMFIQSVLFESSHVVLNNSSFMHVYLCVGLWVSQEVILEVIIYSVALGTIPAVENSVRSCKLFQNFGKHVQSMRCYSQLDVLRTVPAVKNLTEKVFLNFWKLGQSTYSFVNISWCELLWESLKKK